MERVGTLIHKLKDLFDQGASSEQLMATAHMLLSELETTATPMGEPEKPSKMGVSVVMPRGARAQKPEQLIQAKLPLDILDDTPKLNQTEVQVDLPAITSIDVPAVLDYEAHNPLETTSKGPAISEMNSGWLFDTSTEIPTLALQSNKNEFAEINQLMESIHSMPVLNEKLRANQIEIGTLLNNEPIKELKKGIGINDRFLFVQELFRGDESMYERSIKTIDGFAIYPEAQFWIQRELKLKIGWNEDSATVKHFDQLVKRRFS
ncbi:MAG: hypothetical protein RIR44_372 [Bacteroidota bacterium]|jgi:hypothetical protein